jgi:hypothetical protein
LRSTRGVDDDQPSKSEEGSSRLIFVESPVIGTSVYKALGHGPEVAPVAGAEEPCKAAHL